MLTVKLERSISLHPYDGWDHNGLHSIDCNSIQSAIDWKCAYVRDRRALKVYQIVNGRKGKQVQPLFVIPCLACRSMDHRTYDPECPRTAELDALSANHHKECNCNGCQQSRKRGAK